MMRGSKREEQFPQTLSNTKTENGCMGECVRAAPDTFTFFARVRSPCAQKDKKKKMS